MMSSTPKASTNEEESTPLVTKKSTQLDQNRSLSTSGDFKINIRAIFTEFIGTTLFLFSITMAAVVSNKNNLGFWCVVVGNVAPLLALIHALGPISGAHFNPVVTTAGLVTRHIGLVNGLLYIFAQTLGAIAGTAITFASTYLVVYNAEISQSKVMITQN
jgi:aquaglyceroporin related protein